MAMRVITQDGYVSLQALELLINEGLLSIREWEHAVMDVYLACQVQGQGFACDNRWTHGCKPAMWTYLDEYSTVTDYFNGYLCESCAESDQERYNIKLLTPMYDSVHCPDLDLIIRKNWLTYNRMAVAHGVKVF